MFLDFLFGMFSSNLAIDLGTANTLVYCQSEGIKLDEPSVVAIQKSIAGGNRVIAVGKEAKEMIGKTPGNIIAVRPMRDGVIADFAVTEEMLKYFIRKVHKRKYFIKSRLIISIPAGITDVETKAVREAALSAGVREVFLIEQPMAAAIGANLPVLDAQGSMIVDIGGGTTDVAIISLGGLVTSETLKTAGDKMDEAIIQYIRRRHSILIGEQTAELIKKTIGNAGYIEEEKEMEVKGRDLISGVPRTITLSSSDLREGLADTVQAIIEAIRKVLERTPPELSADISNNGIVLCGGGALLQGLDHIIAAETGIPVYVADNPLLTVVSGVGKVLENLEQYRSLLL